MKSYKDKEDTRGHFESANKKQLNLNQLLGSTYGNVNNTIYKDEGDKTSFQIPPKPT